jgi:hypothetical protein
MEPETIQLSLRDGWMISKPLLARRDIIQKYFETIALLAEDVADHPDWGVEVDLRGFDFTNEAFVELYDATVTYEKTKLDATRLALERLSESPKLRQSLLQARASFLRMMLFFCGVNHPLLQELLSHIASYTRTHTVEIARHSAEWRGQATENTRVLNEWEWQDSRSALGAEVRFITEAFYSVERQIVEQLLDRYVKGRYTRAQPLSSGAFAQQLVITRESPRLERLDLVFAQLRANQLPVSVAPPDKAGRGLYMVSGTSYGSVMRTPDALYTMPLAGTEWLRWDALPANMRRVQLECGPDYVLKAEFVVGADTTTLRAYRFNILGRIGPLSSEMEDAGADADDAAMRKSFEVNVPSTLENVGCGAKHALVSVWDGRGTGALWGNGSNASGQLGYGHFGGTTTRYDKLAGAPSAIRVACGALHTLVLDDALQLWGCGDNSRGQLGLPDAPVLRVLTRIDTAGPVSEVWNGAYHTLVLGEKGLFVCGANDSGQLGLGDNADRAQLTPVPVDVVGHVITASCGAFFTALWTDRGFFVSGGATNTWTELRMPAEGPVPWEERVRESERQREKFQIDLTAPLCRYCRRDAPLIQEVRATRLTYCDTECQRKLRTAIRFTCSG